MNLLATEILVKQIAASWIFVSVRLKFKLSLATLTKPRAHVTEITALEWSVVQSELQ